MARNDTDSWDLASSVGATATMVAAARALATADANPLISDPFAAPLVRAVGIDFFNRVIDGEISPPLPDGGGRRELQGVTDSLAVRTRFFDDFFVNATAAGIGQAVILAAGLDSRAYRLAWPHGSIVYEVDQPKVIEFKTATMTRLGATPTAERRAVSIDLREDWPTALRNNGFDERKPSAWSAEGLLMYLPPDAQDRLFDHITALSAPGSQLATEYHPAAGPTMGERAQALSDSWTNLGCDIDLSELFYEGERNNVAEYLSDQGWRVTTRTRMQLFGDYGRTLLESDPVAPFRNIVSVTATRS
jgi:methyltransferase (TIGR00027 family)